jgi:predicted Rossmann-fold nucleotide-binding protein
VLVEQERTVNAEDLNLFKVVDTADEVLETLDNFYKKYNLSPNF